MHSQESFIDNTPTRVSHRPSEFFERHYDPDEVLFNPNFNSPMPARFSQFKSPITKTPMSRSKRSLSPFDNKLGKIDEEIEEEGRSSNVFGARARPSNAVMPQRSISQVRFVNSEANLGKVQSRLASGSPRSRAKQNDNFFGYNRFTNQPSQLGSQMSGSNNFLRDEIIRTNKLNKLKNSGGKKSLAEMVDEVILERESIFFNPDNKGLIPHDHDFEGDTPSRGTNRPTFDPYKLGSRPSHYEERTSSANKFDFKAKWEEKERRGTNFSSAFQPKQAQRITTLDRTSYFSSYNPKTPEKLSSAALPRGSDMGAFALTGDKENNKKLDNISISLLSQLSNNYYDDYDRKITQRYFMLVYGEPTSIDAQFNVNIFKKSPKEKIDFKCSIIIRNVFLEYTHDLAKNIAKTVLSYRLENIHNRFTDVVIRPDPREYQKKLEFHTVLMYLTKGKFEKLPRNVFKSPTRSTVDLNDDADNDWRTRKQHKKEKKLQIELIKIDKALRDINFKVTFKLDEFRFDALSDIDSVRHRQKRHI